MYIVKIEFMLSKSSQDCFLDQLKKKKKKYLLT